MNTSQPTTRELEIFETDGVVCLRSVLSHEEIEGLREAVSLQMRNIGASANAYDLEAIATALWARDQTLVTGNASRFDVDLMARTILTDPDARPLYEETAQSSTGAFFYDCGGWHEYEQIRRVALESHLPEMVAGLLRSRSLHFWEDTTLVKLPGTRQKTAFHQDYGYAQMKGTQSAMVWVPLDRAGLENGAPRYIRGSHRWGKVYAPNMLITQTTLPGSEAEKCPDIEAHEEEYDIISFDVEPGDVIIYHALTICGSGGNLSPHIRRAISLRYCGDDIRYFNRPGALHRYGVSGQLQNGAPLQEQDAPLVWPKAHSRRL